MRDKEGKQLLRAVLRKYVPRPLVDRPKMGFGIPLADWLRGPLRDWADDLLSAERLTREGILRVGPIRRVWTGFLAGTNYSHYLLWDVLMFQGWLDEEARTQREVPMHSQVRSLP
jgi:asparagine synthase (glutamine-hydrolysing)